MFSYQNKNHPHLLIKIILIITLVLSTVHVNAAAHTEVKGSSGLPQPTSLPLLEYERVLYSWIIKRQYNDMGWDVDKGIRDTGPFIEGVNYGTHPAVRIFYSPEIITWLLNGRSSETPIPDGAMIIKEMFTPPAAIYQALATSSQLMEKYGGYDHFMSGMVNSWAVMVKDSKGSHDGWFWASVSPNKDFNIDGNPSDKSVKEAIKSQIDTLVNRKDEQLRYSGFGMPCLRCHATAKSESTFSDLANIKGYSGDPLVFKVDDSWRTPSHIASNYPLCLLKDEPFVKQNFYLPQKNEDGVTTTPAPDDTAVCTSVYTPNNTLDSVVFSDHSFKDNMKFTLANKKMAQLNPKFLKQYTQFHLADVSDKTLFSFPSSWLDHVVMPADNPSTFVTSDNCLSCHGGLSGSPNREVMFIPNPNNKGSRQRKDGFNVSEYGEWRWSPMGLAGRDPIFHAQLESEMAYLNRDAAIYPEQLRKPINQPNMTTAQLLEDSKHATQNLCLSCHGAMGQRELSADAKKDPSLDPNFNVNYYYLEEALSKPLEKNQKKNGNGHNAKYGALAREGVSCMVCHNMDAPNSEKVKNWTPKPQWLAADLPTNQKSLAYNLFHHSTGTYNPGSVGEVFGPFDVKEKPMKHALGMTPVKNEYIQNSQMCGNCHTINLPNIGAETEKFPVLNAASATSEVTSPFAEYPHTIEQATFLEWQNSAFAKVNKDGSNAKSFKSCQGCHMKGSFENKTEKIQIDQILTQIAAIQDLSYPQASHSLGNEDIDIPMRDNYRRHTNVGLNVFLLSMMDQYSDVLGVNKNDYMTSAQTGPALALESMLTQAQEDTAELTVSDPKLINGKLTTKITVRNKTGHRLPSGVAFRRVFIEFTVHEQGDEKPLWRSGGTDELGIIVGANGKPLNTEFFAEGKHQPHYQVIRSEDQAQIYEELYQNAQREYTTSFIHRVHDVKDNRLLPKGWQPSAAFADQGQIMEEFMAATDPWEHTMKNDSDYQNKQWDDDFPGEDSLMYEVKIPNEYQGRALEVSAKLYSQSIPPYWLKQRFDAVKDESDPEKTRATRRLYYMASHLDLNDTPMENWKLLLVEKRKKVTPR